MFIIYLWELLILHEGLYLLLLLGHQGVLLLNDLRVNHALSLIGETELCQRVPELLSDVWAQDVIGVLAARVDDPTEHVIKGLSALAILVRQKRQRIEQFRWVFVHQSPCQAYLLLKIKVLHHPPHSLIFERVAPHLMELVYNKSGVVVSVNGGLMKEIFILPVHLAVGHNIVVTMIYEFKGFMPVGDSWEGTDH